MNGETQNTEIKITEFDRFDFEQALLECWKVTNDIQLFASQQAGEKELAVLSQYYEHKFQALWDQFENGVRKQKIQ